MKSKLLIIALIISAKVFSQNDTIVYYSNLGEVLQSEFGATYYKKLIKMSEDKFILQQFERKDDLWVKGSDINISRSSANSFIVKSDGNTFVRSYEKNGEVYFITNYNGQLTLSEGNSKLIFPLIINGNWKEFDRVSGKLRSDGIYSNNRMISNKYYISDSEYIPDVFNAVESIPEYGKGDMEMFRFLYEHINYPSVASDKNITGKVVLSFVVMNDGSIKGIVVLKKVDPALDAEVVRVISLMPAKKWTPATIEGKKVNCAMTIPISFKLSGPY